MEKSDFQNIGMECFLCSQPVVVKLTKKGKPYWHCNGCGIQVFIRGRRAVEILTNFLSHQEAPPRLCLRRRIFRHKIRTPEINLQLKNG